MLVCTAASSENYAVSHQPHSVLMGPVVQRTEAPAAAWLRAYHPSHSHPSSLVSCLTVGRDASRDISASATLTQPLSLALMSPDGSDRERSPLEPVKDNILLAQPVRSPLIALQFGNRRWRARGTFIEIRAVFGCFPGSHLSRDTRHAACDGMAHAACAPRAAAGRDPRTPRGPPRPAAPREAASHRRAPLSWVDFLSN